MSYNKYARNLKPETAYIIFKLADFFSTEEVFNFIVKNEIRMSLEEARDCKSYYFNECLEYFYKNREEAFKTYNELKRKLEAHYNFEISEESLYELHERAARYRYYYA